MQDIFTIDGNTYNVGIVGLKRSFSILDGSDAGRLKNGNMTRDVVGTYYNYELTLDTNELSRTDYASLYQLVSAPQDSHNLIVPYNNTTLSFVAYITAGDDELIKSKDGKNTWSGLTLQFVAMQPQRRPS